MKTRIFWQNAITYAKLIENNPAFSYKEEKYNFATWVLRNFKKKTSYLIRYEDKIVLANKVKTNPNEKNEIIFRPVRTSDDLDEVKNWEEKYLWLVIPDLRTLDAREWVNRAFVILKGKLLHGIISSCEMLKYPFYSVEINPRKIAAFKQIILPNNRRVTTNKKDSVMRLERDLKDFGFSFDDVYNLDFKGRTTMNIKNYLKADIFFKNPDKIASKQLKRAKIKQKTGKNGGFKSMDKKRLAEVTSLGGKKGAITKKKNALVKDMQKLCVNDKEFSHLVPFFRSKDPEMIMSAVSEILSVDTQRYFRGVKNEQDNKDGEIDSRVTILSDSISRRATELVKLIKPDLVPTNTYNILNSKVNIGNAVENLYNAGLGKKQSDDLATEIEGILKEEKSRRAGGDVVVTEASTVQGETSSD